MRNLTTTLNNLRRRHVDHNIFATSLKEEWPYLLLGEPSEKKMTFRVCVCLFVQLFCCFCEKYPTNYGPLFPLFAHLSADKYPTNYGPLFPLFAHLSADKYPSNYGPLFGHVSLNPCRWTGRRCRARRVAIIGGAISRGFIILAFPGSSGIRVECFLLG